MSANLVVDIGGTCQAMPAFPSAAVAADAGVAISSGGVWSSLSGVAVGDVVDMLHAHINTQLYIAGRSLGSGPLFVGVQTSDSTTSGTFSNPLSGYDPDDYPRGFNSGGFVILGSAGWTAVLDGGLLGSGVSGQMPLSGFMVICAFQRPHRYARVVVGSGFMDWCTPQAGFIGQYHTTGSGGGTTLAPGSGVVNV